MDLDRIETLLEKYWECETSVEEEKELTEFFAGEQVPEKWRSFKPLFQYYQQERKADALDGMFDETIIAQIEPKRSFPRTGNLKKLFYNVARVAAVGLIIAIAGYYLREDYKTTTAELGTFDDPKEAYEETKKALMMISKNFNKGRKQAQKVSVFNEAREKIRKDDDKNL